jgi:hypothetical protein
VLSEPLPEPDELTDHGVLRTFLAPVVLVAASVVSLAAVSVAAANRVSAAPACPRVTSAAPARACR